MIEEGEFERAACPPPSGGRWRAVPTVGGLLTVAPVDRDTQLPRLAERYRVLVDIAKTLTGTLSADDLYRTIYRETARVLETSGFYVSLYDPVRDQARVVFYADRGREERADVTYRGSDSAVLREGRGVLVVDDVAGRSVMLLGDQDSGFTRSAIAAPLRYKGRLLGAISAQSYRPHAYTEEDLELLQAIADLAAVALENARHVTELERQRLEAERIEEIGRAVASSLDPQEVLRQVIDAVVELLGTDGATVWLLDGNRARVGASTGIAALTQRHEYEMPAALVERIVERREPIVIDDLPASELVPPDLRRELRTRSGLVVPLAIDQRVVGALSAATIEPRAFQEDEVRLLERLASQASIALANARLHERVQALSLTDPLTELANRRHLEMHLAREIAAAQRGRALSIVIFDLDHFKRYNDRHGHLAGDEALRAFASVLAAETRRMNLVARYGGDEFISVLSGSSSAGAAQHAQRVVQRVEKHPLLGPAGIRVSWGIAEYRPQMSGPEELIQAADRALYESKDERPETEGLRR